MKPQKEHNPDSSASSQIAGAIIAPIVVLSVSLAVLLFLANAFPRNKDMMVFAFFIAPAVGLLSGRMVYRCFAPSEPIIANGANVDATTDSRTKRWKSVWTAAFASQLVAYLGLCIALGSNAHIVGPRFGQLAWTGFNLFIAASMLLALGSTFSIYSKTGDRVTIAIWSIVLFAIMYFSFIYAATWLADPYTIPGKLTW